MTTNTEATHMSDEELAQFFYTECTPWALAAPGGATQADVILMRKHTPPSMQIKAAGGVRTLKGVRASSTLR